MTSISMTLPTRPGTRGRQPKLHLVRLKRTWLGLCAGVCTAALAGQPAQPPPASTPPPAGAPPASAPHGQPPVDPADDEFIEFLGEDDVGDAGWWEFLKKTAPDKDPPKPAAPPQDAK